MTREEAKAFLISISHDLGTVGAECLSVKDGKKMREAIKALEQEPCEDAISRQAVLDLMRGLTRWGVRSQDGKFDNVGLLYDDVMFGLDRLPSVTPKQKDGHWEWLTEDKYRCSNCNHETRVDECMNKPLYDFCPFCGAKMEVSENG